MLSVPQLSGQPPPADGGGLLGASGPTALEEQCPAGRSSPPPFSSEEQDGPAGGQQPHLHIPALSPAHTCSAEELFAKCRQIRSDKH